MDDFKEVLEMDDDFPDLYEGEVENNDWYNESDTSDDFPDPNLDKLPLFQEENKLPVPILKKHFEEGLMYAMTLDNNHKVTMLVMIIEKRQNDFVYRVFFARSSKRKTYHQGADDSKCLYSKVWRLAPRGEFVR